MTIQLTLSVKEINALQGGAGALHVLGLPPEPAGITFLQEQGKDPQSDVTLEVTVETASYFGVAATALTALVENETINNCPHDTTFLRALTNKLATAIANHIGKTND